MEEPQAFLIELVVLSSVLHEYGSEIYYKTAVYEQERCKLKRRDAPLLHDPFREASLLLPHNLEGQIFQPDLPLPVQQEPYF